MLSLGRWRECQNVNDLIHNKLCKYLTFCYSGFLEQSRQQCTFYLSIVLPYIVTSTKYLFSVIKYVLLTNKSLAIILNTGVGVFNKKKIESHLDCLLSFCVGRSDVRVRSPFELIFF